MIFEFKKIEELFKEINKELKKPINLYVIGGAVLLEQGLKTATKDIDVIVNTKDEFIEIQDVLRKLSFLPKLPGKEYFNMNLSQIFQRREFRIDIFEKEVCGKFLLSNEMIQRARKLMELDNLIVHFCSNEDVFLFKTMTERSGDLDDCESLINVGINWNIILEELKGQIRYSKQDVWITWVGERLDFLEERNTKVPIINEINKLRNKYFEK